MAREAHSGVFFHNPPPPPNGAERFGSAIAMGDGARSAHVKCVSSSRSYGVTKGVSSLFGGCRSATAKKHLGHFRSINGIRRRQFLLVWMICWAGIFQSNTYTHIRHAHL